VGNADEPTTRDDAGLRVGLGLGEPAAALEFNRLATGSVAGDLPEPTEQQPSQSSGPSRSAVGFAAGDAISHYEIIRPIGRGGMGEVYLARDTRLGRRVALKFLQRLDAQHAARFAAEARATAQLTHENIVALYDVAEHDGVPYMVLEYVPGKTLSGWLRDRRLDGAGVVVPPPRAAELMAPVARALQCAHEAGIVHRDLKPANVMLADSGAVKVLDFGIAKLLGASISIDEAGQAGAASRPVEAELVTTLTRASTLVGTQPFMAPEQWRAEPVDGRADLWALGIILYQLVGGEHPLSPLSPQVLSTVAQRDLPMPRAVERLPHLGRMAEVIDRLLLKDPAGRMSSARELAVELEAIARPGSAVPGFGEDDNPYIGLSAFQERDATRFFGRETMVEQITSRLADQPLLALVGSSGAGKSSLIRAGVIPALKRGGDAWESFVMRPGPRPLASLAELLLQHSWQRGSQSLDGPASARTGGSFDVDDHEAQLETTIAQLRREPGFLGMQMRSRARRRQERVLLFVDQFEEVYTLAVPAEREAFLACLAGAADDPSSPLRVIMSLRHDFLDRVAASTSVLA
jgi:serine/threonine protein kinase